MQLRLVRYFLAVAKERHFARAADSCGVTQPTLSAGLAALERQLGRRLILRDRRFIGLTPEGEALLPWARQMVAAQEGMAAALSESTGPLQGEFRLGAIPAALPLTGRLARALLDTRPALSLSVRSLTSREIVRALAEFELDGGLTYLDHEPPADVLSVPIYAETYRVVVRADAGMAGRSAIGIAEVAQMPLCLLHQGMQNRRILDARVAGHGHALHPRVTADSYVTLLSMVEAGSYATIVPDVYVALLSNLGWAQILAFEEPLASSRIGLIVLDRTPLTPAAIAAIEAARAIGI